MRPIRTASLALVVFAFASLRGHAATYFLDTFDGGAALQWTPVSGIWSIRQPP